MKINVIVQGQLSAERLTKALVDIIGERVQDCAPAEQVAFYRELRHSLQEKKEAS